MPTAVLKRHMGVGYGVEMGHNRISMILLKVVLGGFVKINIYVRSCILGVCKMKKCLLILCSLLAACGPEMERGSVSSDGNTKSLITDHTQKTIRISLPNFANELALVDSYDLNGDGIAEFIIAPSADPEAQLQISGNVPKSRLSELEKLPSYIAISGKDGYSIHELPNSKSWRTWAGQFFEISGKTFLFLGRNGEVGLPGENTGEKSVLYSFENDDDGLKINTIWQSNKNTVTSSVSIYVENEAAYILENNYGLTNIRSSAKKVYDTVLYKFSPPNHMQGLNLVNRLKHSAADNYLRLLDYDKDGKIDLLAASEVWKSLDGKTNMSPWPESYVINNVFTNSKKFKLSPAAFGANHAGMAINSLSKNGTSFIIETSTEFTGHLGGGFNGAKVKAYNASNNFKEVEVRGKLNTNKGTFRDLKNITVGGVPSLLVGYYTTRPQVISLQDDMSVIVRNLPIRNYDTGSWASTILPVQMQDCLAFASANVHQRSKSLTVKLSNCVD